jgi:hypothetical protein
MVFELIMGSNNSVESSKLLIYEIRFPRYNHNFDLSLWGFGPQTPGLKVASPQTSHRDSSPTTINWDDGRTKFFSSASQVCLKVIQHRREANIFKL